jgi:DNA-binding response OmpR family regulator
MARILVVDDDERMVRLFRDILVLDGHQVLTAHGGADGAKLAVEHVPDLVLLDVMMPEKDGGMVAQELAENEKTNKIPVIFLTSIVTDKEVTGQGSMISGRLFLSKSISREALVRKVREVLAK